MARRQQLDARYGGTVSEVFQALARTLAFRRWGASLAVDSGFVPEPGLGYRCHAGSVLRSGRVVDVIRPVGITLKEVLLDPPCRVSLTIRCRIEPSQSGSSLHLRAQYRLNHAAMLRARHWDRRLKLHFGNQLAFVGVNLGRARAASGSSGGRGCVRGRAETRAQLPPAPRNRR